MILRILIAVIISLITFIAYYTNSISSEYNEDISCFELNENHINTLRNSTVTWDTTEGGAPMLDLSISDILLPGKISANEFLDTNNRAIIKGTTLQIFLNAARLKPGNYQFTNPLFEDDIHISRISSLPEILKIYNNERINFDFTEQHAKLLKSSVVGFSYGLIGINPKRPYGDASNFVLDIADILGGNYAVNDDLGGNKSREMSKDIEDKLMKLHYETLPALQVLLINGDIKTGKYCRETRYSEWQKS